MERANIRFISIDYFKRTGVSNIRPIYDFVGFMLLVLKIISFLRPLRFYLPVSVLFLVAAVLRGIRDVAVVNSVGSVAVLLFLIQTFPGQYWCHNWGFSVAKMLTQY